MFFWSTNHFVWNGPKGSRRARKSPKWSKISRLTISNPCGPLWTTMECWQACHVWPFLFVLLVRFLLGHPVFLEHYFGSFIISYFQFTVMVEHYRMSQMHIIFWMTNPDRQKKANWCFPACVLTQNFWDDHVSKYFRRVLWIWYSNVLVW